MKKNNTLVKNIIFDLYKKKIKNYNSYLRKINKLDESKIIKISYDLQAGSYVKSYYKNLKFCKNYAYELSSIIKKNFKNIKSFIDCGCGEMIYTPILINQLKTVEKYFLFDISLARVLVGKEFLQGKLNYNQKKKVKLFCSNMDSIPLKDNSIDLVFTNHAIEPNKKKKESIIKELYRISRYGIILNEPDYESASILQKKRMIKNNYAINIGKTLKKLKLNFYKIKLRNNANKLNKTTSFIIFKKTDIENSTNFVDPFFKEDIISSKNFYFSKRLKQIYFKFKSIPIFDFENPTII